MKKEDIINDIVEKLQGSLGDMLDDPSLYFVAETAYDTIREYEEEE